MKNITQQEWRELLATDDNAVIVDVRTSQEQAEGVIPNAVYADINTEDDFNAFLEQADKSKNYYVYCRSGMRSQRACNIMDSQGFKCTYNLLGGIVEWEGQKVIP
ncbi:MAG: rhodanese-like domain-containing protein [Bacteroidota bacterium]|nr:rhodanese-like domain-containing protein [Bacteroidota bacterium]